MPSSRGGVKGWGGRKHSRGLFGEQFLAQLGERLNALEHVLALLQPRRKQLAPDTQTGEAGGAHVLREGKAFPLGSEAELEVLGTWRVRSKLLPVTELDLDNPQLRFQALPLLKGQLP